ncbi:PadR family transcriptional regulator [bacterium]|nr:PadR family transcriptional regulator [bacterium]
MKLLTRAEEYVLLAVWRLKGKGYTLIIQDEIELIAGEKWSLGTIYAPLERLEKRGYIVSNLTKAVAERGGRQKRIYQLTGDGHKALVHMKSVHESFWADLPHSLGEQLI